MSAEAKWPASKVTLWPIEKIIPYDKNPRTHPQSQIDLIAASMLQDGVTAPIMVDDDGVIIYGHGRRLGALKNGFEKYPVIVARGWTEEQKLAARIKDNQIAMLSGWDKELVGSQIGSLHTIGYDVALLGFSEPQLLGWGISSGTNLQDPEQIPELPKNPIVKKGDLWILGDHQIICGDCTKPEDVRQVLGTKNPKLMVTDPPYGVDYDPDWRNRADRANGKAYGERAVGKTHNDNRSDWYAAWELFPGDVVYCWHAVRHASTVQASFEKAGFELRAQIIWAKTRMIISRGHYHMQHEPCWYLIRKGKTGNWSGDRSQTTLWTIDHQKSETGHSAQKPIECMKRPIQNNSRKGDYVYEPFSGSGTTIIACEMTGRRCLAVEIDPSYVQVAVERWQTATGQLATCDGLTLEEVAKRRPQHKKPGPSEKKKT